MKNFLKIFTVSSFVLFTIIIFFGFYNYNINTATTGQFTENNIRYSTLSITKNVDFNNDGVINLSDWSIFLFRWGSKDSNLQSKIDLNKDNKVDISDFSIFLKQIKLSFTK